MESSVPHHRFIPGEGGAIHFIQGYMPNKPSKSQFTTLAMAKEGSLRRFYESNLKLSGKDEGQDFR